jgi:hypothetical protein
MNTYIKELSDLREKYSSDINEKTQIIFKQMEEIHQYLTSIDFYKKYKLVKWPNNSPWVLNEVLKRKNGIYGGISDIGYYSETSLISIDEITSEIYYRVFEHNESYENDSIKRHGGEKRSAIEMRLESENLCLCISTVGEGWFWANNRICSIPLGSDEKLSEIREVFQQILVENGEQAEKFWSLHTKIQDDYKKSEKEKVRQQLLQELSDLDS